MALVSKKIRVWWNCWICPRHKWRLPNYDPEKDWWYQHHLSTTPNETQAGLCQGRCFARIYSSEQPGYKLCLIQPRLVPGKRSYIVMVPRDLAENKKEWPKFRAAFQERFHLDAQNCLQKRTPITAKLKASLFLPEPLLQICQ